MVQIRWCRSSVSLPWSGCWNQSQNDFLLFFSSSTGGPEYLLKCLGSLTVLLNSLPGPQLGLPGGKRKRKLSIFCCFCCCCGFVYLLETPHTPRSISKSSLLGLFPGTTYQQSSVSDAAGHLSGSMYALQRPKKLPPPILALRNFWKRPCVCLERSRL